MTISAPPLATATMKHRAVEDTTQTCIQSEGNSKAQVVQNGVAHPERQRVSIPECVGANSEQPYGVWVGSDGNEIR